MIDKGRIHPVTWRHLTNALDAAKRSTGGRLPDLENKGNQRDFGSNSERMRMVTEKDHIYLKSLDSLIETSSLELRPGKARRFSEWLELNYPETFEQCKIVVCSEVTKFFLGG